MKRWWNFVVVVLIVAFVTGLKAQSVGTWFTSEQLGGTPERIVATQYADSTFITSYEWGPRAVFGMPVDSVWNSWTLRDNALNQVTYQVWWSGFSYPVAMSKFFQTKQYFSPTELFRLAGAYWATPASTTLTIWRGILGDSLEGSYTRTLATNYDTTLIAHFGKVLRARVSVTFPGALPVSETYEYNLLDTLTGQVFQPVGDHLCRVIVSLHNSNGTPAAGLWIQAYPARSNLYDSSGASIISEPQYERTNVTGEAYFTCIWSSYLIPSTKWVFVGQSPAIGGLKKIVEVPRTSLWVLDLRDSTRVK